MAMGLWWWALLVSSVGSVDLPDITDKGFIELCVREHNRARSEVSPPATDMLHMSWDEGLAVTAKAWARHCIFKHNPNQNDAAKVNPTFSSVGENLWVGFPPSYFSVAVAIQRWVNEMHDYSYNSNSCSNNKMCTHYTQVVWANSYKVGCAVHLCSDGIKQTNFESHEAANFVCNYAPAGNVNGWRPYQTNGSPCSKCDAKDNCVDKLCRSKDRDTQKGYSGRPDRNLTVEEAGGSDSDYISVLIIRPVALVCMFIAAFAVKHFYPDVFCYE